jgi:hypothetical protein
VAIRTFLFQSSSVIFIVSLRWGQGASTGALRGAVLEAQAAAIASADIVAIWVETGIRDRLAAGVADNSLSLDSTGYYQRQAFSSYPNSAFDCQHGSGDLYSSGGIAALCQRGGGCVCARFSSTSGAVRRYQFGERGGRRIYRDTLLSFLHGMDLIRARDVNLPPPTDCNYSIYDPTGSTSQRQYYNVESFAT